MDFDFTDFRGEEIIVDFMLIAIAILKKHLHRQTIIQKQKPCTAARLFSWSRQESLPAGRQGT